MQSLRIDWNYIRRTQRLLVYPELYQIMSPIISCYLLLSSYFFPQENKLSENHRIIRDFRLFNNQNILYFLFSYFAQDFTLSCCHKINLQIQVLSCFSSDYLSWAFIFYFYISIFLFLIHFSLHLIFEWLLSSQNFNTPFTKTTSTSNRRAYSEKSVFSIVK